MSPRISSRAGQDWRAGGLVLAAIAAAFLVVPALAGSSQPTAVEPSATSEWTSCPYFGFDPTFKNQEFVSTESVRTGFGGFVCSLQLPHGARVTAVEFHLLDQAPGGSDIGPCEVYRVKLDPPTGGRQRMAGPLSSSGSPGYVTVTDTSILRDTVNNRSYAYYASCLIQDSRSDLGIVGVSVRYKP